MYPPENPMRLNSYYDRNFIPAQQQEEEQKQQQQAYYYPYRTAETPSDGYYSKRSFNSNDENTTGNDADSVDDDQDVNQDGNDGERTERDKRNILDDAKKEIFEYYWKINNKKKGSILSDTDDKYKKVQVQEQEMAVPRVQVNAGYENPKIQCEGAEMCSGVLLKWVLTLYGSNESMDMFR